MAFTSGNDINILQASDTANIGAGAGNDTYVLTPANMTAGQVINISDAQGANTLMLTAGITIVSSAMAVDSLQLIISLAGGGTATINVLGANTFNYKLAGNGFDANSGVSYDYSQLINELGATTPPTAATPVVFGTPNAEVNADGTIGGGTDPEPVDQTLSLTGNPDNLVGGEGDDLFIASNVTLSAADVLDGAGGNDTLRYASENGPVVESGFAANNIENLVITADAVTTTFDVTGITGLETVVNSNSAGDLNLQGGNGIYDLVMQNVSNGDTSVDYDAAVVAGANDTQKISLNDVLSTAGDATSAITVDAGIENVAITTTGSESQLIGLNVAAGTDVSIAGTQDLTIENTLADIANINASGLSGDLDITVDATESLAVTAGSGDDRVAIDGMLSDNDTLDGGAGEDTLSVLNAQATAPAAVDGPDISNFEILGVRDAAVGTIDMGNFPDIEAVVLETGMAGDVVVDNAVSGITVSVEQATDATDDLSVQLAVDGTNDVVTVVFDSVGDNNQMGNVIANDAETININVTEDEAADAPAVTLAGLSGTDATKLVINSAADLTLAAASTTASLTTVDASASTGNVDLANLVVTIAAGGADFIGGEGDDTFTAGTGADTFKGNDGADTYIFSTVAQSSATRTDIVTDFVSGEDVMQLTGLPNFIDQAQFVGNFEDFGSAQGALLGNATPGTVSAVYEAGQDRVWVDVDGNGTLDSADLRILTPGVASLVAADLGLLAGNTITLTAPGAVVDLLTNDDATDTTTIVNDTINTTVANLAGSRVDGAADTTVDTLVITDQVNIAGGLILNDLAAGGTLNNIEAVVLQAGTATASGPVVIFDGAGVAVTANAASSVILGNGALVGGIAVGQSFTGSTGDDFVSADSVADFNDTINSGAGNDQISVFGGHDRIDAGAGNDVVTFDSLFGVSLEAPSAPGVVPATGDTVNGGAGFDVLQILGDFANTDGLNGVTNFEALVLDFATAPVTLIAPNTFATAPTVTVDATQLGGGAPVQVTFDASAETTSAFDYSGSTAVDIFRGGAGNDTVDGGNGGVDSLLGNDGNDTFQNVAFTGVNLMVVGGSGTDTLILNAGQTAVDGLLGDFFSIENFVLNGAADLTAGASNDTITGSTGNDTIDGGAGNDIIDGGAGNDSILGGAGNDTITDGAGNDTIGGGAGADRITLSNTDNLVDTIVLTAVNSNVEDEFDTIVNFNAVNDDLSVGTAATQLSLVSLASATTTNLAASIQAAINTTAGVNWAANTDALLIEIANFNGQAATFIAVNETADAFFNGGDILVQMVGMTGTFSTDDIIA